MDKPINGRPVVWTVAVSESGAGADFQHELRVLDAFGAQGCIAVDGPSFAGQLEARSRDRPPAAVKTGRLGSAANVHALVRCIDRLREVDPRRAVVIDPVLRASTGAESADEALLAACRTELLPRATLIALNPAEAAALLGLRKFDGDSNAIEAAAHALLALGCEAVAITGADAGGDSRDFLMTREASGWLVVPRVPTWDDHNHGHRGGDLGSVFAAGAAAGLARGFVAADAAILAKMMVTHKLRPDRPAATDAHTTPSSQGFARLAANLPWLLPPLSPSPGTRELRFAPLADPRLGLYAVVDSAAWVRRVLDAGVRCVQLRIKDAAHPWLRDEIRDAVAAARAADAQLFVNDHWQLAVEEGAYGVHLGQDDLRTADLAQIASAGLRLGVSSHAYWEVCRARALNPSYIACGPVHATDSKPMPWIPQGNDNLAYWCALLAPTPVVAIAGMDCERAAQAVRCGAAGVAVITAITRAPSPEQAIDGFMRSIEAARRDAPLPSPALPRPTLERQPRTT